MASEISESMKRRIDKEQAMFDSRQAPNPNKLYPSMEDQISSNSSGNSNRNESGSFSKDKNLPTPPPDYGSYMLGKGIEEYWSPSTEETEASKANFPQIASEACVTLICDICLLALEGVLNLWLAILLYDQELYGPFWGILALLAVPSLCNAIVWAQLSSSYRHINFCFMFILTLIGMPAPLFVYIWQLYHILFCDRSIPRKTRVLCDSKILTNAFRITQAFFGSFLLILLNAYTLFSVLKVQANDQEALDLHPLSEHLDEVKVHGLAALVSFLNILRAASLFNERKTFSLVFVLVGYPFLLFTTLSRIFALAIVVSFAKWAWITLLFLLLVVSNAIFYFVTRKRPLSRDLDTSEAARRVITTKGDYEEVHQLKTLPGDEPSSPSSSNNSTSASTVSEAKSVDERRMEEMLYQSQTLRRVGRKFFAFSLVSAVIPAAYTNDYRSHHPRIKGGVFIVLNFLFNTLFIGLALGLTIINAVPNTIYGVSLPQPSLQVNVPGSQVKVQAAGLDVALNLPNTNLDLGSMPTMSATLNTDNQDLTLAIAIPLVLAFVTIPFVVMRAAMMELECFITRKKHLDEDFARISPGHKRSQEPHLRESVRAMQDSKEVKARMYMTLCCSVLGMCVFTVLLVIAIAFIAMQFH